MNTPNAWRTRAASIILVASTPAIYLPIFGTPLKWAGRARSMRQAWRESQRGSRECPPPF
jgi:hypothetical protein